MALMKATDVARYIGVNVRTVYRKAQCGELPCYRLGASVRFKKEEIDEAMKGEIHAKKASTRCRSNPAF